MLLPAETDGPLPEVALRTSGALQVPAHQLCSHTADLYSSISVSLSCGQYRPVTAAQTWQAFARLLRARGRGEPSPPSMSTQAAVAVGPEGAQADSVASVGSAHAFWRRIAEWVSQRVFCAFCCCQPAHSQCSLQQLMPCC